jgi:hypothetical protein
VVSRSHRKLLPFLHSRLNHVPVGQHDNVLQLVHRTVGRLRETHQPERRLLRAKLLRFQCAELDTVKGRHELCRDLSRLSLWSPYSGPFQRSQKRVLQRTAVLGRTSVSKQLDGHGRNHQQECDQDCREGGHSPLRSFLRHIQRQCQSVEKSVGKADSTRRDSVAALRRFNSFRAPKTLYRYVVCGILSIHDHEP